VRAAYLGLENRRVKQLGVKDFVIFGVGIEADLASSDPRSGLLTRVAQKRATERLGNKRTYSRRASHLDI